MIRVQRLEPAGFAEFGHVARSGEGVTRSIRADTVLLSKSSTEFGHDEAAIDLALDFYDVQPEKDVVRIVQAERHAHSSQMFVPMAVESYLVVVWDGDPRAGGRPSAFLGGPRDVVIYHPGVWHHGIIAIGGRGLLASTMWRTRGGTDVEFVDLPAPLEFAVERGEA